jgi:hypothetical protein
MGSLIQRDSSLFQKAEEGPAGTAKAGDKFLQVIKKPNAFEET